MRVLLIGNGAREHIIAERLAEDAELYAVMSKKNPAIANLAKKHWICDIENAGAVSKAISGRSFDLGFASPDATLEAGVSDALEAAGTAVASPTKAASRIEWDKSFMRFLLERHKVPGSPKHEVVKTKEDAERVIKDYGMVAIKPLGLTGGKGVKVSGDHFTDISEKIAYADSLIKKDGSVLIEEKLVGEEFTLQCFSDGSSICAMPPVQDHKRAWENDRGPNCYSSDTEVLTDDGWKTFDKLKSSDKVMVYDKYLKKFQFQKPKKIYWMKYAGQMINFKNRDVDLIVTPNHRMLLQQRKGRKKVFVLEAQEYKGEHFILQSAKWDGVAHKNYSIPQLKKHFNFRRKKITFIKWVRFLALFLSEGYSQVDRQGRGRVYICQTKKSRHLKAMEKVLKEFPFEFIYENNNGKFRTNSAQLARFLLPFGDCYHKFVPDYIKNSDERTIREFLKYFCMGDGDIHMGKQRFHSASKRLIDDIQEMLAKIGCNGIIVTDKRTTMKNPLNHRTYKANPVYSIEMKNRTKTSIRKKHIRKIRYNGYVGCVNVSTGFVLVRRNGRVAICGNTGGMGSYSSGALLPFMEERDLEDGKKILQDVVLALKKEGAPFKGVLYGQFMATKDGIKVIEFNARFGDPEAMNVLSLLEGSLSQAFMSMASGKLKAPKFSDECTVVKYLVPDGYPEKPLKDARVEVDAKSIGSMGARVYYASVYEKDGSIFTSSSRAFGILGKGETLEEAERIAEKACGFITGPLWHRKDIGTKALIERRVGHMKELRG